VNLTSPPITKTAAKRQASFEKDFYKLLKKHKAIFEAYTAGGEASVIITMLDECNGTHILAEYVEFHLPEVIDGATL
jgi:hypothetical protein